MKPEEIRRLYDRGYASIYDDKFLLDPLARSDTEAELIQLANFLSSGTCWLDVACGTGFFLRHFPNVERAGLDLSPAMLELARKGNEGVSFYQRDFREPFPEWNDMWGLVSCMWYAYGYLDSVPELLMFIENLWAWTAPGGTCFVPLADPRLISGVDLPYLAPTNQAGKVMITGITWSYVEDDGRKVHSHMLAPQVEFMVEQFRTHFGDVKLIRYPSSIARGPGRPAIVARAKYLR